MYICGKYKISNKEQTGSWDIFMTGFINVEIDLRVSVSFRQIRKLGTGRVCRLFLIIAIQSCCWRVLQSSFKRDECKKLELLNLICLFIFSCWRISNEKYICITTNIIEIFLWEDENAKDLNGFCSTLQNPLWGKDAF